MGKGVILQSLTCSLLVDEPSGVPTTGKVGSLFLNEPAREDTPTELPSRALIEPPTYFPRIILFS